MHRSAQQARRRTSQESWCLPAAPRAAAAMRQGTPPAGASPTRSATQWQPRLARSTVPACMAMALATASTTCATSAGSRPSTLCMTQSPSMSSSRMSMMVQRAASTTMGESTLASSSCATHRSPASAAANQKQYLSARRWSRSCWTLASTRPGAPRSSSCWRQEALTSATRPRHSTAPASPSPSAPPNACSSRVTAASRAWSCPGSACAASTEAVEQMAAMHLFEQRTAPGTVALRRCSSRTPTRSSGKTRTSSGSTVPEANSAMASRLPRTTAGLCGAV
mmetsp:Transcript_70193/g.227222  ORF Transcript_70193/g.227222 Transcript_70193/m.227222 type:complete len:280 (-) Transcript_70193:488-1327(-)